MIPSRTAFMKDRRRVYLAQNGHLLTAHWTTYTGGVDPVHGAPTGAGENQTLQFRALVFQVSSVMKLRENLVLSAGDLVIDYLAETNLGHSGLWIAWDGRRWVQKQVAGDMKPIIDLAWQGHSIGKTLVLEEKR